ncbi:MAG: hypothetical protein AABY22_19335, partial [Nanoarchaeota archaeon]
MIYRKIFLLALSILILSQIREVSSLGVSPSVDPAMVLFYKFNTFPNATETKVNETDLTFVATTTAQAHTLLITNNSAVNNASLLITYSYTIGAMEVFINGYFVGNITGSNSPLFIPNLHLNT